MSHRSDLAIALRRGQCDAEIMKSVRVTLGLRQDQLAAAVGYRPETISRFENGVHVPRVAQLALVALLEEEA